jgi:hypothetical protein
MGEAREEMRSANNILVGKREEKRLLGTVRRRMEDNIEMNLGELWLKVMDWIYLAHDRDR